MWAGIVMTDLSPAFASQFHVSVLSPEPHAWGLDYYAEVIQCVLGVIDSHLADRDYFLGDGFSFVDALMYPSATSSTTRLECGLDPYPALCRWRDRVGASGRRSRLGSLGKPVLTPRSPNEPRSGGRRQSLRGNVS